MSLVAHRFGRVELRGNLEYEIFVLILSSAPALRKQKKYHISFFECGNPKVKVHKVKCHSA